MRCCEPPQEGANEQATIHFSFATERATPTNWHVAENVRCDDQSAVTSRDIGQRRLANQHIASAAFDTPADEVKWLVAVQAQDHASAKWSLGLRLQGAVDRDIEQAFTAGAILRTHLMRPTWHFVTPADIRWLLALTAPRVHAAIAYMDHKLGLDQAVFKRSNAAADQSIARRETTDS